MSKIVLGVGASHSTLMNTHWDAVDDLSSATAFRDALYEARDLIAEQEPDVAIIIGSNHFRGFWLDLLPAFTIGVGECIASGESGTPKGPQPVDTDLARAICSSVVDDGFDPAFSVKLQIDHGISHAIQYLLDGIAIPIVPVVVNMFAPPLPTPARAMALGSAIRAAVGDDGSDKKVVVIGSGGLSHQLPWPRWYDPHGADDEFMVEAWTEGRNAWEQYDPRRREIIRAATAGISPDWDEEFLNRLEKGDLGHYGAKSTEEIEAAAGNGAQEIRSWLMMAAAAGHGPGRTLTYQPIEQWLTGMGVAVVEPSVTA